MKTTLVSAVVAAIIAGAVLLFGGHAPAAPKAGALAGPVIASPYLSWGGVPIYNASQPTMYQATTTLCAIQNPSNATSSLQDFVVNFTVGTSTSLTFDLATSTSQYATSSAATLLKQQVLASSGVGTFTYDPSASNQNIVGPSQWVDVVADTAGLSGYQFTGDCSGQWIVD